MRAELERIEQIERYLMDKLSQSDKANFEMELGNDAVLQSQVEFQENLMEGLQRMGLMHDAKNAYKLYRKRLWYKYFGFGIGVVGLGLLAVVLWSYNSVNYCACVERTQQHAIGESAMTNDGNCVDTCSFVPAEVNDVSIPYYEDKKEGIDFIPKQIEFQGSSTQNTSEIVEGVANESNNNLAQIIRPAFESVSEELNGTEDDNVEAINDWVKDAPFYYQLSEVPYMVMPATKNKLLRYLLPSDRFLGRRSRNPRKNLGTILSSNNNEAYFDAAKKKRKRLIIGDTPTEYVVNKELKMDSASMEPYFVYDTIPVGMNIPSLRVKGKNSNRNWVNWEIEAVEIDSVYVDIVFNVSQRENSYIYSITEESEFNMPTQFLFRNVSGEYDLVGEVREFGMETFDREENYDSEGPVCHSTGNDIQFRQRIEMKSDSASILINYAYMVCALGVSTQYPVEDSIILALGWSGGKAGRTYRAIEDDLGEETEVSGIKCPNVMTPNGDRINDFFRIDHKGLKEFSISIYDRAGDIAFKSSDPDFKWDGRNEGGLLLPDGAYGYHIDAIGVDEKPYKIDGEIFIRWQENTEIKEPVNPDAADVSPLFPGGEAAMFRWLNEEMDLSQLEGDGTVSGTIIVDYTVSETGKVTDIVIREGLTPELDQHVINVFKRMPDWSPGIVDGEPVSVYFSLPVVINNF